MGKLEKSLNETVEDILKIAPKTTVAKIATLLGVNRRSVYRTKAWTSRKNLKRGKKTKSRVKMDDYDL